VKSSMARLSSALSWLRDQARSLFVESGPRLTGSFLRSLVDRLVIFDHRCSGAGAPQALPSRRRVSRPPADRPIVDELGNDMMTTYAFGVPCSQDYRHVVSSSAWGRRRGREFRIGVATTISVMAGSIAVSSACLRP
jgi:hypothetical protein